MAQRPKLILHTATDSARTAQVLENADHIESLPIDGMVINIPQSYWLMDPAASVPDGLEFTREAIDAWFPPELVDLNARMENNYLVTFIDRPGDLADDAAWAAVADNFRVLAEAAKDAGFKGLIFDNEEYGGRWDNFPEDWPGADPSDLPEYQALASQRGREVMEAVAEVFPDAEFGVMHGPYASVDGGAETPSAITNQVGGPQQQELRGPFLTGLLEGKGPDQKLIDMGELYGARTADAFAESQAYRIERVPDLIDWDVPQALLDNWDDLVTIDHMVSTDQFPQDNVTPETLEVALKGAFAHSEETVFLYSSVGSRFNAERLDWFVPGDVRPEWIEAVSSAVAAAEEVSPSPAPRDGPVVGTEGADLMMGTSGDDRLTGLGGNDAFFGGAGRDRIDGGEGRDRVDYSASQESVVVNLRDNVGWGGDAEGDQLTSIEAVSGSRFADLFVGSAAVDDLMGGGGDDELYGNGGKDWLQGGAGADLVAGGAGRDMASYMGSSSGVTVDLVTGEAAGGHAEGDRLIGVESLQGSVFGDRL
ncbi:MAG: calcium-binding protein, partial [Pseudomonadota bacterium]